MSGRLASVLKHWGDDLLPEPGDIRLLDLRLLGALVRHAQKMTRLPIARKASLKKFRLAHLGPNDSGTDLLLIRGR